jgi:hypothetical protein
VNRLVGLLAGSHAATRGSVEFTAGPDALLTIDASGKHPTIRFRLRNHEDPPAIGVVLEHTDDGLRFATCEPAKDAEGGAADEEVRAVLRQHAEVHMPSIKFDRPHRIAAGLADEEMAILNAEMARTRA